MAQFIRVMCKMQDCKDNTTKDNTTSRNMFYYLNLLLKWNIPDATWEVLILLDATIFTLGLVLSESVLVTRCNDIVIYQMQQALICSDITISMMLSLLDVTQPCHIWFNRYLFFGSLFQATVTRRNITMS